MDRGPPCVRVYRGGPRPMAAWATARGAGPNFFRRSWATAHSPQPSARPRTLVCRPPPSRAPVEQSAEPSSARAHPRPSPPPSRAATPRPAVRRAKRSPSGQRRAPQPPAQSTARAWRLGLGATPPHRRAALAPGASPHRRAAQSVGIKVCSGARLRFLR
jgi:hypothetical protein